MRVSLMPTIAERPIRIIKKTDSYCVKKQIPGTAVGGLFILNLKILSKPDNARSAPEGVFRPPSRLSMKNPPTAVGGISVSAVGG